jgi:hypothetical protein
MRAHAGHLAQPEFAAFTAFAAGREMSAAARWELPFALFAARLDRARTVVDRSTISGPLPDAIATLYPQVRVVGARAGIDRVLCVGTLDRLAPSARAGLVADAADMLAPDGLLVVAGDEDCAAIEPLCARHGLQSVAEPSRDADGEPIVVAGRGFYGRAFAKGDAPPPGLRVAFGVLSWNTREVLLETVAACVREAEMLVRLGHQAVVLVCDNGSTDGTPAALQALDATIELPHHFLFNDVNRGISTARNQMIALALDFGADYVMLLDGDIEPVPFATYSMLRHLEEAGPDVGAVWPSGECYVTRRERASATLFGLPDGAVTDLGWRVFTGYILIRSAVFERGVLFDESPVFAADGYGFEDFDFGFQLHAAGFGSHCFGAMRFLHRFPNSSLDVMRRLGIDARVTAQRRKEWVLRKWQAEPRVAEGVDFIRRLGVI